MTDRNVNRIIAVFTITVVLWAFLFFLITDVSPSLTARGNDLYEMPADGNVTLSWSGGSVVLVTHNGTTTEVSYAAVTVQDGNIHITGDVHHEPYYGWGILVGILGMAVLVIVIIMTGYLFWMLV